MANDRSSDIKAVWHSQETEGFTLSLEDIRARSSNLQRKVRIRNLIEYGASVAVVAIFGCYAVLLPGVLTKLGSVMIILATFYMVWQLHKRGSARTPPLGGSLVDHMTFYRGELARQRDALSSVATWYLAPFVPGLVIFVIGRAQQAPSLHAALPRLLFAVALMALVYLGVWLLNRKGASRIQKVIDALARMNVE